MRKVEVDIAASILEELLDEVEHGATIMLTRNGVDVVRIVPYRAAPSPDHNSPKRS